ncbi:MAG: type IV pilus secretin PilQ [Syntrophales bacterium]
MKNRAELGGENMKRARRWGKGIFLTAIVQSLFLAQAWGAGDAIKTVPPKTAEAGYLENVSFEKLPGKERVKFSLSRHSVVIVEQADPDANRQAGSAIAVRMDNIFVPEGLRRSLGETVLTNVIRVTPVQKSDKVSLWAIATIEMNQKAPFSIREEGNDVIVDFNVASLPDVTRVAAFPANSNQEKTGSINGQAYRRGSVAPEGAKKEAPRAVNASRIVLDVQEADIKAVFRLLAEQGNVNIVSGDDVKGTITVSLKDVTWDQALDTILEIKGLSRKTEGNIVTVMSTGKIEVEPFVTRVVNVDYTDAKKLTANLLDLLPKDKDGKTRGSVKVDEHSNALIIQATRQDITRLLPIIEKIDKPTPQILIKANIVETTKDTARNLGIQWGGMYGHKVGSQGLYITPGGVGGTAVAPGSAFTGDYAPTAGAPGISGQGFGVNFPAAMTATASGSLGLLFGTIGENILEIQLNALQKDGKLNILSSPSITTMDNQKAFTENGEKVPYVTTDNSGGTTTKSVKFENAVLRLEITPHVIDGKNLTMKILVQKDEVDPSRSVDGNPYIIKKQTETSLIVQDGETIVISGLTKQRNTENVNGIPWLKDVPVLGWLFKGEGKSESMEEVLIFITPNILNPAVVSGIQGAF